MKKLFLMFCTIAVYTVANAQTLTPVLIANAGKSMIGGNVGMKCPFGEVVTSILAVGGDHLPQESNQPKITFMEPDPQPNNFGIVVYPNPTGEFVTIQSDRDEGLLVSLHDVLGQTVIRATGFTQKANT